MWHFVFEENIKFISELGIRSVKDITLFKYFSSRFIKQFTENKI